jgi:hypothetical protein
MAAEHDLLFAKTARYSAPGSTGMKQTRKNHYEKGLRAEQHVVQEGSSPFGIRMRSSISLYPKAGIKSLAGEK